jgi:hypothetical protein
MTYLLPSQRPVCPDLRAKRQVLSSPDTDLREYRFILGRAVAFAKNRSKVAGHAFDLTPEFLVELVVAQNFRCAMTRMHFRVRLPERRRNPLKPSIDRIIVDGGYTRDNVRVTTTIANIARADFGDDIFYAMCEAGAQMARERKAA